MFRPQVIRQIENISESNKEVYTSIQPVVAPTFIHYLTNCGFAEASLNEYTICK